MSDRHGEGGAHLLDWMLIAVGLIALLSIPEASNNEQIALLLAGGLVPLALGGIRKFSTLKDRHNNGE